MVHGILQVKINYYQHQVYQDAAGELTYLLLGKPSIVSLPYSWPPLCHLPSTHWKLHEAFHTH